MIFSSDRSPFSWLNSISREFLGTDYLLPRVSPEQRIGQMGETAARRLKRPELADKFYDYAGRGWYSIASPVWTNFGLDRGLPISCYGSYISDSMESILKTHAEIGMMSKFGGGTSAYMTPIRGRGAEIRDNGKSNGSVHFARLLDLAIIIVSQGSSRRGQCACYWDIDHPDIMDVLDIKMPGNPIQQLSFGVCVKNAWMEAMIAGDEHKRTVWAKVLKARGTHGYPYLFFVDNANDQAPPEYKELGLRINHSNLCVTGDQRVVSDRGLKTVKQLADEGGNLVLFDNTRAVKASPMRLIERDALVYRITLDNGMTHTVTDYHSVLVRTSPSGWPLKTANRRCAELTVGDPVAVQTNKGMFGTTNMPEEAFLLGLYHGDGTQTDSAVCLDVWQDDFDLIPEIEKTVASVVARHHVQTSAYTGRVYDPPRFAACTDTIGGVEKRRLSSRGLKKIGFVKYEFPDWLWAGDEQTMWAYVRGILYTGGTVEIGDGSGNPLQLNVSSVNRAYLQNLQLLFANLGLKTSIHLLAKEGKKLLPDGRGGKKLYACQDCWRLVVGNKTNALTIERRTGFLTRRGKIVEDRDYRDNSKKFHKVVSVEPCGRQDVYCCTVDSTEHHWVCNGVVTHNCSEIALSNSPEESFVCCLSSMNDLFFDEWRHTDAVEVMIWFLDAVMSEFIEKARDVYGMDRAVRFAERQRALGLGQLGWHSYLQSKMIPFESMEAARENVTIAKTIRSAADAASKKLAAAFGEPEYLRGKGRRNMTLLAIAPTKSSSAILGQVSEGIEPYVDNYGIKDDQKLKYTFRNPFLLKLLEEKGLDVDAVMDVVLKAGGSVQRLPELTDREKAVFRTFGEISPMEIVRQAAQRQPYIDQGQSVNLWIDSSVPTKEVNALLIEAWRSKLKALYYQKNTNAAQKLARSILSCSACEG